MKKSVFSVEVNSAESKRQVLKGAASLHGIMSLSIDSNKKKLTVVGDIDPVQVVHKLGKKFNAKIETVEQNKNKGEMKKGEVKDGELEKKDIERFIRSLVDANYHNYRAYHDYGCPRCNHPAEDHPFGCVIS